MTTASAPRSARPTAADVRLLMELSRRLVAVAVRSVSVIDGAVSLPQIRALTVLDQVGPCNAGSLAASVGLHVSTITRLCDRLVELDLITRVPNPENRREVELRISDGGAKLVRQVQEARSAELAKALVPLSRAQRECLREVIPPLLDGLDDVPAANGWA